MTRPANGLVRCPICRDVTNSTGLYRHLRTHRIVDLARYAWSETPTVMALAAAGFVLVEVGLLALAWQMYRAGW